MQFNTEQEYLEYLLKEPDTSTFQSCMEYIEAIENWSSFLLGGFGVDVVVNGTACMLPIFFGNNENNISITSTTKLKALQAAILIFREQLLEYQENNLKEKKLHKYIVKCSVQFIVSLAGFKEFQALDIADLQNQVKLNHTCSKANYIVKLEDYDNLRNDVLQMPYRNNIEDVETCEYIKKDSNTTFKNLF